MSGRVRSFLSAQAPRMAVFEGPEGRMVTIGTPLRHASLAALLCGADAQRRRQGRIRAGKVTSHCLTVAAEGAVTLVAPHVAAALGPGFHNAAIDVPPLVDLDRPLPDTLEALQDSLRRSTTREDMRRIRKAGFVTRIETAPPLVRHFHQHYSEALVTRRFPGDGQPDPLATLLERLEQGGELICLDAADGWLAGIFNQAVEGTYALGAFGILDGRDDIRRRHVTAALILRSFERAVEIGLPRATLGRSLPVLGKGAVWFKAKWGGVLHLKTGRPQNKMLIDLRHAATRQALARHPLLLGDGTALAVAAWLAPGADALRALMRDIRHFRGPARWYILGEPAVLTAAQESVSAQAGVIPALIPVPVPEPGAAPLWLAQVIGDLQDRAGADHHFSKS